MFKIRNNDTRSYGIAGRLCVAGSGCPTPPEAAKQIIDGQPFRLPPLFELTEDEMFKSYRGIIAVMKAHTRMGTPAIEVFVEGVPTPLAPKDIEGWLADHRSKKGLPEPRTTAQHTAEAERAMARPEDPIEVQQRLAKEQERNDLVKAVAATVAEILRPHVAQAAPDAAPRGRNDEKPETEQAGRARPRP